MINRNVMWLTSGLSVAGMLCTWAPLSRSGPSMLYVGWHLLPYVIAVCLSIMLPRFSMLWLGGAALMLAVDAWVAAELLLNTNTPYLMSAGLLATLKLPVLLPVGSALGAIAARMMRP